MYKRQEKKSTYDVIALDIDNGPEGLTTPANTRLYSREGISKTVTALRAGGVIAYWSATEDKQFCRRLQECGLQVQHRRVYAHGNKGARHMVYLATPERD